MPADIPVITVDGPSGTGKGTLSSYLANWLQWHFLDSGALYRVLALAAERHSINYEDVSGLAELARDLDVVFKHSASEEGKAVILEGTEVSVLIRTESCGTAASRIASLPEVRQALLDRQHSFRKPPGLVADGRDMGTVVFPAARLKIFLTASVEERARRRYKQLKEKGFDVNLPQLSVEITERDVRDSQRTVSPLRPAVDAAVIDTTHLNIEDVIDRVAVLVRDRFPDITGKTGRNN
ncbi:MAG: cytidylate kinase [Gammaproteobacteria bacterium RIFCSPLOWO2_02_FULL_47_50]|nr:MAG: cytidylate kinase [Gammaproteobacteria bacterium RIFCSPLOWO2_01_FULL_47_190]OGT75722.1 MAG: cytidylate kinase [Gammaproteobacteria bacterium RIFCSPLOWO2_12_47_11]OGT80322.1 MAG: cytidylate kinase [Gammaproteobacteria bacterium RIFCSPLOWO2_02_FULL_47_50]OGT85569.1 MAG: cytidylate kinase [Gammaproteobacteria bacterium RIFCSPLOWO2_12_FULL_47_76]